MAVRGERVRELRIEAGLTQREVAHVAGISANTISALETGSRRGTSVGMLAGIAKALRVQPHDLRREAVAA